MGRRRLDEVGGGRGGCWDCCGGAGRGYGGVSLGE